MLLLSISLSIGNLAILPYIKKYDVIFVLFYWLVLYAINMGFTNLFQSYISSNFDSALLSILNNSLITSFINSNLLSNWIIWGHSYRQIIFSYKNHATYLADLSGKGLVFAYFII